MPRPPVPAVVCDRGADNVHRGCWMCRLEEPRSRPRSPGWRYPRGEVVGGDCREAVTAVVAVGLMVCWG